MLVYSYAELDNVEPLDEQASLVCDEIIKDFLHLGYKHSNPTKYSLRDSTLFVWFTAHSCSILILRQVSTAASLPRATYGTADLFPVVEHGDVSKAFHTRYYLMMIIALLYRAVLLDFSERGTLVSRRLLEDQQRGRLTLSTITMVNDLRLEFLNCSSHWHFDNLSCKQTDNDLFRRLCSEYKISDMKRVIDDELTHMGDFACTFYQLKVRTMLPPITGLLFMLGESGNWWSHNMIREMYGAAPKVASLTASRFGTPAIPNVSLSPMPPACSTSKSNSAEGIIWKPVYRVSTWEKALS